MDYLPNRHITLEAKDMLDYMIKNCVGRENAKSIESFCMRFMLKRRQTELLTEELREAGIPLCSSLTYPAGMYLAKNYEDALPWVKQIDARLKTMSIHKHQAVSVVKRLAENEGIQTELAI